jgi:hypothetical protein
MSRSYNDIFFQIFAGRAKIWKNKSINYLAAEHPEPDEGQANPTDQHTTA